MLPIHSGLKILDYGCGDGAFFELLSEKVPVSNLYGFDPALLHEMTIEGVTTYDDANELVKQHPEHFDMIFCMEVCEHLTDAALEIALRNIRLTGKPDATFIFGVPLETGLSGFAKNLYRTLRNNRQRATIGRAFKSLLSIPVLRAHHHSGWIGSHIGFDYVYFKEMLQYNGFYVSSFNCLPWPLMGRIFNNEIYYLCKVNPSFK
jgi:SAM-dependent methyltransferase